MLDPVPTVVELTFRVKAEDVGLVTALVQFMIRDNDTEPPVLYFPEALYLLLDEAACLFAGDPAEAEGPDWSLGEARLAEWLAMPRHTENLRSALELAQSMVKRLERLLAAGETPLLDDGLGKETDE